MAGLSLKRSRQAPAEETSAFGGVAERFRRAGDLDRAIALCREGLQKFPDLLSARVTLGWSLLDKGEFAEARTELQQVLKRAPDNLAAIRGLAELHDRMDGAEGAVESWHQPTEGEAVEAPKAPKAAKTPTRAAKASRGKSKRAAAEPEPVAVPEPEPEIEEEPDAEPEPELEPMSEGELAASQVAGAVEVEAPAILSAAAAAIEAAETRRAVAPPAKAPADEVDVMASAGQVVVESTASEPVAGAEEWHEATPAGVSEAHVDAVVVAAGETWEEPAPVAGEPGALPHGLDHAHGQEAWEDVVPAIAEEVAAVVDAGVVLGDAGDTDEVAELERLLATVELADSSSSSAVVLEDAHQPTPIVTSTDAVPLAELVTAADLAIAGTGEPSSFTSLDSPVTLPDAPAAVVPIETAEPVASAKETVDEAQTLAALPPLDLIQGETSTPPAPAVQSPPAKGKRSAEPAAQQMAAPVAEQAAAPAAPEVVPYQPSPAYEPATSHQPAAWHAPASPQLPTSWPDAFAAHTPAKPDEFASLSLDTSHSSRHAVTSRVSHKRAQVAALEKLLRRVEARRLRLQAQSVA